MTALAAPLDRAVERLRDDLKYVNARWVEADAGSDAADVIRSAEELLAALDAYFARHGEKEGNRG